MDSQVRAGCLSRLQSRKASWWGGHGAHDTDGPDDGADGRLWIDSHPPRGSSVIDFGKYKEQQTYRWVMENDPEYVFW
jgi:hypothetical protein